MSKSNILFLCARNSIWEDSDSSLRFLSLSVAEKYDLDMPEYQGLDQIVEISSGK